MRIGCSLSIEEVDEDGENVGQVGPAATLFNIRGDDMPVRAHTETGVESVLRIQAEREEAEKNAAAEAEKAAAEAEALASARAKIESETPVVYTRMELEGIGANDGIAGLRAIAETMDNVKGRSVTELVAAILKAQAKALAA